jgi:hypothetical protein
MKNTATGIQAEVRLQVQSPRRRVAMAEVGRNVARRLSAKSCHKYARPIVTKDL